MTSLDILRQQLAEVATRRAERDALAGELKTAREAFEASVAHKTARLKQLSEGVAASENAARIAGIAAYTADNSIGKKPVDGITLQDGTLYTYDADEAFAWAKRAGMCLIPEQLDTEAFLKVAKATPLPFVRTESETRAVLGKDLSSYLLPQGAAPTETPREHPPVAPF